MSFRTAVGILGTCIVKLCGGEHRHIIVQKNEIAVMFAKFSESASFFLKPPFESHCTNTHFEDPKPSFEASPSKLHPLRVSLLQPPFEAAPLKPSL